MKKMYSLLILAACIMMSCSKSPQIDVDSREVFEKEYAAWKAQNIENYKFTYNIRSVAGPVGPVTIIVKNGESLIVQNQRPQRPVIAENISEVWSYINSTFDDIERFKNESKRFNVESISLNIKYNEQYHYPEVVRYIVSYFHETDGQPHYNLNVTEFIPD